MLPEMQQAIGIGRRAERRHRRPAVPRRSRPWTSTRRAGEQRLAQHVAASEIGLGERHPQAQLDQRDGRPADRDHGQPVRELALARPRQRELAIRLEVGQLRRPTAACAARPSWRAAVLRCGRLARSPSSRRGPCSAPSLRPTLTSTVARRSAVSRAAAATTCSVGDLPDQLRQLVHHAGVTALQFEHGHSQRATQHRIESPAACASRCGPGSGRVRHRRDRRSRSARTPRRWCAAPCPHRRPAADESAAATRSGSRTSNGSPMNPM